MSKLQRTHGLVGDWLADHPEVIHEKSVQNAHGRYRYGFLTVTWYKTGTVLVQGVGVGNLVFNRLNCTTCQGQPKIIQALNWMVHQMNRKVKLGTAIKMVSQAERRRELDRRLRERKKRMQP